MRYFNRKVSINTDILLSLFIFVISGTISILAIWKAIELVMRVFN